jgi:HEAT repeat protein
LRPRKALERLASFGVAALPQLVHGATQDSRVRVRSWCAEALGGFDDLSAGVALRCALADANMSVRLHALRGIIRHGRTAMSAHVLPLAHDSSPGVRHVAVRAIGRLRARGAGTALVAALRDEKWHVRQAAAEALAELRWKGARKSLVTATADARPAVRNAAQRALDALQLVSRRPRMPR